MNHQLLLQTLEFVFGFQECSAVGDAKICLRPSQLWKLSTLGWIGEVSNLAVYHVIDYWSE